MGGEPVTVMIICGVAFLASALTFFFGVGLGTLLLPVFAVVLPGRTGDRPDGHRSFSEWRVQGRAHRTRCQKIDRTHIRPARSCRLSRRRLAFGVAFQAQASAALFRIRLPV